MFVVQHYPLAVWLCILTMLCWGSWANTQKLASRMWPFQLFYWDYTIGILVATLAIALTFGSYGVEGRAFLPDLYQANWQSYLWAFLGGVIFNLANILLVTAIDIAGMSVAFPIAIGLALVIGVIVNYLSLPVGNAFLLTLGVAAVVIAIILDGMAYQYGKSLKTCKSVVKGLTIAFISGVLMGCFYRFVAMSMSVQFIKPSAGFFTPYTACVVFAVGIFISNFLWNGYMMRRPLTGQPTTYTAYFKGSLKLHGMGILGGLIWGVGTIASFLASGKAGYAISYGLGQGATLIAALWGVFIWHEFRRPRIWIKWLLAFMFVFYLLGLVIIVMARFY